MPRPTHRRILGVLIAALIFSHSAPAQPVNIPGLFPTGVNDQHEVRLGADPDPHYTILGLGPGAVLIDTANHPAWVQNPSISKWIWEVPTGGPFFVTRIFRTTFDLSGLDPATASITGEWAVDNIGLDIRINGLGTGAHIPFSLEAFMQFHQFEINGGFGDGINTIDFIVEDVGTGGAGFHVGQITGTADALCAADRDGNGTVDSLDLLAYLQLWFEEDPLADLTGEEPPVIEIADLLEFLQLWFAGC